MQPMRSRLPRSERSANRLRSPWGLLSFILALAAVSACRTKASAQRFEPSERCNAAACEDQTMLLLAIDSAIEATDFCRAHPARVLSTVYAAPYTELGDGARGRAPRNGVPSSPASLRLEDLGILSARRFRHNLTIVDSSEVLGAPAATVGCLVVASPPSLRENGQMRVVVALSQQSTRQSVQLFLFIQRDGERWVVARSEVGLRT